MIKSGILVLIWKMTVEMTRPADVIAVPATRHSRHRTVPHLQGMVDYHTLYKESIQNPSGFWTGQARDLWTFIQDFHTTHIGSLRTAEPPTPQDIENALVMKLRTTIGPFAAPKRILIVKDLPKTRSGKIVRRILRKALAAETEFGDVSTVSLPWSLQNM